MKHLQETDRPDLQQWGYRPALLGMLLLFSGQSLALDWSIKVTDDNGIPVENAVVYAEPKAKFDMPMNAVANIEQKGKKFLPLVSVVPRGTSITFPNRDTVRHHVYSFSPAKTFELKLYSGVPASPVLFDKAGTVVLGCNIHDNMLAFIHIVDTPYFAKTDAGGNATLSLPAGDYTLKAWHYALINENQVYEKVISLKDSTKANVQLSLRPFPLPGNN